MAQSRLSDHLGSILKNIYVPQHVITAIIDSVAADQGRAEAQRRAQITSVEQRLATVRTRMDQAYADKLDGKLDERMWTRKMRDWRDPVFRRKRKAWPLAHYVFVLRARQRLASSDAAIAR